MPDLTIYEPSDTLTPYEEGGLDSTTEDFYGSSNQNDDDDESDGGSGYKQDDVVYTPTTTVTDTYIDTTVNNPNVGYGDGQIDPGLSLKYLTGGTPTTTYVEFPLHPMMMILVVVLERVTIVL